MRSAGRKKTAWVFFGGGGFRGEPVIINKDKGKGHLRTGHEVPEWSSIDLLFL